MSLDALIVLNLAGQGMQLRSLIGDKTRLILCTSVGALPHLKTASKFHPDKTALA